MSNWDERLIMRRHCPPCFISLEKGCFYFDSEFGSLNEYLPLGESRLICQELNDYYQGYMVRPVLKSEVESNVLPLLQNEFGLLDATIWVNETDKPYQISKSNTSLEILNEILNVSPSTYQTVTLNLETTQSNSELNRRARKFDGYYDELQLSYTLPIYLPEDEILFTLPSTETSTTSTTTNQPVTTRSIIGESLSLDINATTICVLEN